MAELNSPLQSNPIRGYQFQPDPNKPDLLNLTTDTFLVERGPRYKAYAALRESKLRLKHKQPQPEPEPEPNITPPPKRQHVKLQHNFGRKGSSSVLAQSVPDFSAALRKENRKPPAVMLPPVAEKAMTPPAGAKSVRMCGSAGKFSGSKSANSGEKRNGGIMGRKSYANLEDFTSYGDNRRRNGRTGRGILGNKQFFWILLFFFGENFSFHYVGFFFFFLVLIVVCINIWFVLLFNTLR